MCLELQTPSEAGPELHELWKEWDVGWSQADYPIFVN